MPETLYLDFTGRGLRDAGMKVARLNADSRHPNWTERAVSYVKEFTLRQVEFMGEDVRAFAEAKGFEKAPSARSWGTVMVLAARRGVIRKIGTRTVRNPRAHCANASVWRPVL